MRPRPLASAPIAERAARADEASAKTARSSIRQGNGEASGAAGRPSRARRSNIQGRRDRPKRFPKARRSGPSGARPRARDARRPRLSADGRYCASVERRNIRSGQRRRMAERRAHGDRQLRSTSASHPAPGAPAARRRRGRSRPRTPNQPSTPPLHRMDRGAAIPRRASPGRQREAAGRPTRRASRSRRRPPSAPAHDSRASSLRPFAYLGELHPRS